MNLFSLETFEHLCKRNLDFTNFNCSYPPENSWRFGIRLLDIVYIFIDAYKRDRTKTTTLFCEGVSFFISHSLSLSQWFQTSMIVLQLAYIFFFFELYPRLVIYVNCCMQFHHVNTPHCIYPSPVDGQLGYAHFSPSQFMLR